MCANCRAKFQHGEVYAERGALKQIIEMKAAREGGAGEFRIELRLCGKDLEITSRDRHLIDLQDIIKALARATKRETGAIRRGQLVAEPNLV